MAGFGEKNYPTFYDLLLSGEEEFYFERFAPGRWRGKRQAGRGGQKDLDPETASEAAQGP